MLDRLARFPRPIAGAFLALASVAVVSVLMATILAVDRGLDQGDELLYLLAVTSPAEYFWTNPWGWITRPLWLLAGERIDAFRLGGALALAVAFYVLIRTIASTAAEIRPRQRPASGLIIALGGIPIAVACTLMYYSGFLRTPGYNWANLLGLILCSAAALQWAQNSPRPAWMRLLGQPCLMGLGLVVSGMGKPSTPFLEVLAVACLGWALVGLKPVTVFLGRSTGAAAIALLVLWATGLMGPEPLETFRLMVSQPQLVPDQTLAGALVVTAQIPLHAGLWALQYWYFTLVVALLISSVTVFRDRVPGWLPIALLGAVAIMCVLIWIGLLPAATRGHNYMLRPEAVITTLGLLVACAVLAFRSPAYRAADGSLSVPRVAWVTAGFLVLQPFIFAFGTSNGPFQQMTWALGFVFLAALFLCGVITEDGSARAAVAIAAGALLACATWVVIEGWEFPYGMKPLVEQTQALEVLPGSQVLVDPEQSARVSELRGMAERAGLPRGQSIATVTFPWGVEPPLLLGGKAPPSLMITLFTADGAVPVARFNIARPAGGFDWHEAWLALEEEGEYGEGAYEGLTSVIDLVAERADRTFPAGYERVGVGGGISLWKPRQ